MSDTIDCREAAARLQDFLKQELTPEVAAGVQAHLEKCRPCFAHARFERTFVAMLETRARQCECPDALRARVASILRAEMERD